MENIVLSAKEAETVILSVWNGRRKEDRVYFKALGVLGLDRDYLRDLRKKAREVCCGRGEFILSPTGGQPRRRR